MKKVYFIGIKGVGMAALAIFLKQSGMNVSGSDVDEVFHTDEILKAEGIEVKSGFKEENVPKAADLVIVTGAHNSLNNPEAIAAKNLGIRTIPHGRALGEFMNGSVQLSVAGCHGKTTTTGMLATIFSKAHLDPSYILGAASTSPLGSAGHKGAGKYFIAEADEYLTAPHIDNTPRFLWQHPDVAVITNIEFDHPDAYKNIESVIDAYSQFAMNIKDGGLLVLNKDDKNSERVRRNLKNSISVITYGFSEGSDFKITEYKVKNGVTHALVSVNTKKTIEIRLQVPGKHNIQNATAAFVVAEYFKISEKTIQNALLSFKGAKRRFEKVGSMNKTLLYDDYAHHPTEIQETYKACKEMFPGKRIMIVFQPHTYSRTEVLENEFIKTFVSIKDPCLITDIFASKREDSSNEISSQQLVNKIRNEGGENINYIGKIEDAAEYIKKESNNIDIVITMGAGDIYKLHQILMNLPRNYESNSAKI